MDQIEKIQKQINENSSFDFHDFRILYMEVRNNPFLGDLTLNFVDLKDEPKQSPYTTLIIGPNGTGKSNILRALIQIFREIKEFHKDRKRKYEIQGQFQLIYLYDKRVYRFGNFIETDDALQSSEQKQTPVTAETIDLEYENTYNNAAPVLPSNLIAASIMLTDKYPVLKDEENFPNYKYLGVRRSPNIAGTRTYVRRTVKHLVERIDDPEFIDTLYNVMDFLELEDSLKIQYHPKYQNLLFKEDSELTPEDIHRFFKKDITHPKRKSELWGKDYYNKIRNDRGKIEEIAEFCNSLSQRLVKVGPRKKSIQFDLLRERDFKDDYTLLKDLQALDFVTYPTVILKNKNSDYTLNESSSGEYHIFSTLIGILATINEGSVVLIDEPEISLHPNWQMKYMHYIREIFKKYKSCHFIIATHSHFLVSDLSAENSCVVALSREKEISATTLKGDTFGWSAEQTLLDVFRVPTTRNYFVAEKVGEILDLVSKEDRDEAKIQSKVKELKASNLENLSEEDPLKVAINKLFNRYL